MRLLTLNTHSLLEENYGQKLKEFITTVARELPDVIALQEVNQIQDATAVSHNRLEGYVSCEPSATVREGNHALAVAEGLRASEIMYHWTWLPIKKGYGQYDEGVAVMSRSPIVGTDAVTVSHTADPMNWKTRKLLGIRTEAAPEDWFYSVHFGWWADADEPFAHQWRRAEAHLNGRGRVWLLGDFNNPAHLRGEGYDLISASGWRDTFAEAAVRDDGVTVARAIDGWSERAHASDGLRIDQIWCNHPRSIRSSQVIFNGKNAPVVSDHFGVMIETE